nr:unnamed protein product [Callosobruchus analis]
MVTPTPSERACPPPVHVNIGTDTEKPSQQDSPPFRIWRKVRLPHAINGFLVLFVTVLLIITEYGYIPGTKMGYTCQDPNISHKYRGEVITPVMLGVGCVLLPLLVLVFTEILLKDSVKRMDVSNLWFFYKECLIGGILVLVLTEMAKIIVGEHRPHFLDVCEPDTAVGCSPGTFIIDYKCTSTKYSDYFLVDSSRSFPSGHSSVSVFVGIFSAVSVVFRRNIK